MRGATHASRCPLSCSSSREALLSERIALTGQGSEQIVGLFGQHAVIPLALRVAGDDGSPGARPETAGAREADAVWPAVQPAPLGGIAQRPFQFRAACGEAGAPLADQ